MKTAEIRQKFLDYFKGKKHQVLPSSPVIPHRDPTLLFTNAGMNQFKDLFLGGAKRDYTRATTSQKCIRAGGKHNDLENVGHTRRHLTFFEMLGNFSFGDYFKKEAIQFAWEFSTEILGLDPRRIWPSVYLEDDEAFELWTAYVSPERIARFGKSENFWAMGDTGPCGPCSELYYDRGPSFGPTNNLQEDPDSERFLEFWNLVFMQFNTDSSGTMTSLPKPSIDTGMGLERLMSLLQNTETVFEIDLFREIIAQIENVSQKKYLLDGENVAAFRVIADHLRTLSFAIADGAQPSNVDRGYVLRKILRRAVRYGRMLGMDRPFLGDVLPRLIDTMGGAYPELTESKERITEILTLEEEAFLRTLKRGGNILNQVIDKARDHGNEISGDDAFKLKDTYGLPLEEILLIANDAGLDVDSNRFNELEEEARERSRAVHKTTHQQASESIFEEYLADHESCAFEGYHHTSTLSKIQALLVDGSFVHKMEAGQEGLVILDRTPFYAEMGGQVGDTGALKNEHALFDVINCQNPYKGIICHQGMLQQGTLKVGDTIKATINIGRRQKIANNHTATHLLHWALRTVLGSHVRQAGSVVDSERLRFDFSHHKALNDQEIRSIEDLVNEKIRENRPVAAYEKAYTEVQGDTSIIQFFGEKYDSRVRVIDIDYSKELCGGTHTHAVGTIGYFRIAKEGSIAAGVRRIEAVTGTEAETLARASEEQLQALATKLKTPAGNIEEKLLKLLEENQQLEKKLKQIKKEQLQQTANDLSMQAVNKDSLNILIAKVPGACEELKDLAELLIGRLPSGVLVIAAEDPDRCLLIARASEEAVRQGVDAGKIIKAISHHVEGSGGGKAVSAQAGGKKPAGIPLALEAARQLLTEKTT